MISRKNKFATLLTALTLGSAALAASPASAAPAGVSVPSNTAGLTITMNAQTGAVVSVTKTSETLSTNIVSSSTCTSTSVCWRAATTPYASTGFSGSPGTKSGSWAGKGAFYTGSYTASGTWTYLGKTLSTGKRSPRTTINMTSAVTATSATIY